MIMQHSWRSSLGGGLVACALAVAGCATSGAMSGAMSAGAGAADPITANVVLKTAWLRPAAAGMAEAQAYVDIVSETDLDLVGAFKRDMRETDDAAMRRADVIVVDDRQAVLAEGGDIVQAIASGAITGEGIAAELRDFARGTHPGRTRDDEITVFKSVGLALEDLAAAEAVLAAESSPIPTE